jgi:hypothetical protein
MIILLLWLLLPLILIVLCIIIGVYSHYHTKRKHGKQKGFGGFLLVIAILQILWPFLLALLFIIIIIPIFYTFHDLYTQNVTSSSIISVASIAIIIFIACITNILMFRRSRYFKIFFVFQFISSILIFPFVLHVPIYLVAGDQNEITSVFHVYLWSIWYVITLIASTSILPVGFVRLLQNQEAIFYTSNLFLNLSMPIYIMISQRVRNTFTRRGI